MNLERFLRDVPPFDQLTDATLAALAYHAREVSFRRREVIVRAGEPGDAMYVVAGGQVSVRLGGDRHLGGLGPGEIFGEMALITGEPRTADVVADEKTICVAIDRLPFQALLKQSREVATFLTDLAGRRLLDGEQIARVGKYRVLHAIGRGGMGTVFAGYHEQLRRPVALKMLNHALVMDPDFAARFAAEAEIVAGLQHPNIVQVFDHEEAYATQFIVMELLGGETLGDVMERHRVLDEGLVRRSILQVAAALGHAHAHGITHRDVKPDNVMRTDQGTLKLMDFGIAGRLGDGEERPVGTPIYMAPEQMRGVEIDQRADIYALGVMAFVMLTADAPHYDEDPDRLAVLKETAPVPPLRDYRDDLSEAMATFVERACAARPEDRFASCDEVAAHFGRGPLASPAGARRLDLSIVYDPGAEGAVRGAVDRLAADLAGHAAALEVDDLPES